MLVEFLTLIIAFGAFPRIDISCPGWKLSHFFELQQASAFSRRMMDEICPFPALHSDWLFSGGILLLLSLDYHATGMVFLAR